MKVLAVTGGAQGIGRAVALHFGRAGYSVSIADTNENAGLETIRKLNDLGAKAVFVLADVSQAVAVGKWMQQTFRELGCPDVLINNAAIGRNTPFLQLSIEDFDRVIAVNLRGTVLCS